MPYYERRYASTVGGGPIDKLGREGRVLCDRCGFGTHHRLAREGDPEVILVEDAPGWAWDPQGPWCWDRRWSTEPRPCDRCGREANEQVPLSRIAEELERIDMTRALRLTLAAFNLVTFLGGPMNHA